MSVFSDIFNGCYRISDPTEGAFIDYGDAVELIDGLAEAGTMGVELTGGEPTIHPQFVDILEHAGEQLDLVGVLTNGMAIDETMLDRIEAVADSTLIFFSISLDSHDPAFHNKFRGEDAAWSKTVQGIRGRDRPRFPDAGLDDRHPRKRRPYGRPRGAGTRPGGVDVFL